jgi:hypothetical protein
VDEAIDDGVGEDGIADEIVPSFDRELAGGAAMPVLGAFHEIVPPVGVETALEDRLIDAGQHANEPREVAVSRASALHPIFSRTPRVDMDITERELHLTMKREIIAELPIYREQRDCAALDHRTDPASVQPRRTALTRRRVAHFFEVQFTDLQRQALALLGFPEDAFRLPRWAEIHAKLAPQAAESRAEREQEMTNRMVKWPNEGTVRRARWRLSLTDRRETWLDRVNTRRPSIGTLSDSAALVIVERGIWAALPSPIIGAVCVSDLS